MLRSTIRGPTYLHFTSNHGEEKELSEENKLEFVQSQIYEKLIGSRLEQLEAFRRGFTRVDMSLWLKVGMMRLWDCFEKIETESIVFRKIATLFSFCDLITPSDEYVSFSFLLKIWTLSISLSRIHCRALIVLNWCFCLLAKITWIRIWFYKMLFFHLHSNKTALCQNHLFPIVSPCRTHMVQRVWRQVVYRYWIRVTSELLITFSDFFALAMWLVCGINIILSFSLVFCCSGVLFFFFKSLCCIF